MICSLEGCERAARYSVSLACRPFEYPLTGIPHEIEGEPLLIVCAPHGNQIGQGHFVSELNLKELVGTYYDICSRAGKSPPQRYEFRIVLNGIS